MNGHLKISAAAEKWEIKERRINALCLEGAIKLGNIWVIPEDADKPKNERIKQENALRETDNVIFSY